MTTWISDGYEKGILSVNGSTVRFGTKERGTPFNIRLDDDNSDTTSMFQNSFYIEVDVKELEKAQTLSAGIVGHSEFFQGWKCKGMFYNGNLTNGSAALVTSFGDFIKCGDVIGVYVVRSSTSTIDPTTTMDVLYYLNGRCLGSAFKINTRSQKDFYPCLTIDGNAMVDVTFIRNSEYFPSEKVRQPSATTDTYSGDWLLKRIFSGPELHECPLSIKDIILSFSVIESSSNHTTYNLSTKVANHLRTQVTIIQKIDDGFDKIEVGRIMSTMMRPDPVESEMEQFLSSSLPTLYKMIVSSSSSDDITLKQNQLILTGAAVEFICERYVKQFDSLTMY